MQSKITHWIVSVLVFGIPLALATHSPELDITIGGVLNAIYLYASHLASQPTA